MKESLAEEREALIAIDPRIPFAIERFLQHTKDIYADQFNFAKFDVFGYHPDLRILCESIHRCGLERFHVISS
jgi:hypothetical protein